MLRPVMKEPRLATAPGPRVKELYLEQENHRGGIYMYFFGVKQDPATADKWLVGVWTVKPKSFIADSREFPCVHCDNGQMIAVRTYPRQNETATVYECDICLHSETFP